MNSPPMDYSEWLQVMPTLKSNFNNYTHPQGAAAEKFEVKTEPTTLLDWRTCSQPNQVWCINPHCCPVNFAEK